MDQKKPSNQLLSTPNLTNFIDYLNSTNILDLDLVFCFNKDHFDHCFLSLKKLINQLQSKYNLHVYNFKNTSWLPFKNLKKTRYDFTLNKKLPSPILNSPSSNLIIISDFILPSSLCCLSGTFANIFPILLPLNLPNQSKRFSIGSSKTSHFVIDGKSKSNQLRLINHLLEIHQLKLARRYTPEIFCLS